MNRRALFLAAMTVGMLGGAPVLRALNVDPHYVIAAIGWPGDKVQFFFNDGSYARYDIKADKADDGYPALVNEKAWPGLAHYDGSIVAACNGKEGVAYFFLSTGEYLRYDIADDKVDAGYPKPIDDSTWPGLGNHSKAIASCLNWKDGKLQFFLTDGTYIRYDIAADHADPGYPQPIDDKSWPGVASHINRLGGMISYNGKAFMFLSDGSYLRYDIAADKVETGYPKWVGNDTWPGIKP